MDKKILDAVKEESQKIEDDLMEFITKKYFTSSTPPPAEALILALLRNLCHTAAVAGLPEDRLKQYFDIISPRIYKLSKKIIADIQAGDQKN